MLKLIKMRNIAFANPESVSIFAKPKGKRAFGGHLDITDATSPTQRAKQSNNMCMESEIRPRELVTYP